MWIFLDENRELFHFRNTKEKVMTPSGCTRNFISSSYKKRKKEKKEEKERKRKVT